MDTAPGFNGRWQSYVSVAGVACLALGLLWDISWHISIGRDTFWQPAHIVIQLGGVVPAALFGWQALQTTFRGDPNRRAGAIRFWGARGAFGGWVTMWGAVAMLTSAPFDDWWHNTYGLDVKIVSPPHAILGLGMFAVTLGVLFFVLSRQNRASSEDERKSALLFTLAAGLMVTMLSVYATEYTWPNRQHTANYYRVVSVVYPFLLVACARASKLRWPATMAAGIYMVIMMGLIWVLPLFPAQPKLAPIYNPVDHMVPPPFPMLLVFPALLVDLWLQRRKGWTDDAAAALRPPWHRRAWFREWILAAGVAATFLAATLAVQWFFSRFLLSPRADNWFFAGSRHWPYYNEPGPWRSEFWDLGQDPVNMKSLALVLFLGVLSSRAGLTCGGWMLTVKR